MKDNFARAEYSQTYEYREYIPYSERVRKPSSSEPSFSRNTKKQRNAVEVPGNRSHNIETGPIYQNKKVREKSINNTYVNRKSSSIKTKSKFFVSVSLVGVLMFGLLVLTAITASVKFSAGEIKSMNSEIQSQIDYHNVQLKAETNAKKVEEFALSKLGMVFVEESNEVVLGGNDKKEIGETISSIQ